MQVNTARIRGLMAEHGDTQQDLAEKLGVTRTTVNTYLQGVSPITLETATKIAKIYNADPLSLITVKE